MGWLARLVFGLSATGGVALAGTPLSYNRPSSVHIEGLKIAYTPIGIVVASLGSFQTKSGLPATTSWKEMPAAVGATPLTGAELATVKLPATV